MADAVHTQSNPNAGFTPRVFSGIQPSGGLTLGNYLGAIKRFVQMQDSGTPTIYCVVDLHAITVWQDPEALRRQTRELTAGYIAAGLDPSKSILFNQSQVVEHAQLAWIFNCVARMGWMGRMTQWKDKAGKNAENASLGLFAYPALMAADILLYHATHVPVGEDQKQHLELTRDVAAKFNHDYGVDFFPITEPVIEGAATRVMSLRDGSKKMSKSDPSDASRINMTDDADTIAKKIRKAKTDPEALPSEAPGLKDRADARNLVNIYAALSDSTVDEVLRDVGGKQFSEFKPMLADLAVAKLSPISTEMARLMQDPAEIDRILGQGAARAREIATPILQKTYEIVGMIRKLMEGGAISWLARLVLTGLLIASLALAGINLATLARAPAGAALVERGSEGIAAATERALVVDATPEIIATRLDALLVEEPRNWLAIEAVEALAVERAISLPADLLDRRAAAWEADSGFLTSTENCGRCIWDATTCDISTILMCRAPVELSPIGDVAGVLRAILAYLAGRDVDEVDVILSVIGLTSVALAISTGGSSLAIKTGAGLAKLAKSMKRLPDALTRPLVRAFREGLDTSRFSDAVRNRDLMRLFRPEVMRPAAIIVEDAGRLVGNTSALGALHLMKFVDDPADLSRLARVSDALGARTVGAVEVLGKARLMRLSMRVADEVWFVFSGLIGALAALLGLLQSLFGSMLLRVLRRMARLPGAR